MKATSWVQLFNTVFAISLSMLYYDNVIRSPIVHDGYIPTGWDYWYFVRDKTIFVLLFACLLRLISSKRVRFQLWFLFGFSFLRLTWQVIEFVNNEFGLMQWPFFILSIAITLIVLYLTVPVFLKYLWLLIKRLWGSVLYLWHKILNNSRVTK